MVRRINTTLKCMTILDREQGKGTFREIARKYGISKTSAHRLYSKKDAVLHPERCVANKKPGRKRKLSERDVRRLDRAIVTMRKKNVNFTAMDVVKEAGFRGDEVHKRTFSRYLNELGYKFLISRKKGLLSDNDKVKRLRYSRQMIRLLQEQPDFYKYHVAFYLDGVSFVHKYNPYQESINPKGRVWRKNGEGLAITAKGSKDLPAGRRVHFLVAIAYSKGVVLIEEYNHMNGSYFAEFVRNRLNVTFAKAGPKYNSLRLFVMDNDPSQNSRKALSEIEKIEATIHAIPARSPDLNPIENIFNNVKKELEREALAKEMKHESYNAFKSRVINTLNNISVQSIDKTIDTMPKRLKSIIELKGSRTKY